MAAELAACGVGSFRLVDGEPLEAANIPRHQLKWPYVGQNKAEGMAVLLLDSYPPGSLKVGAVPRHVDGSMSDNELDELIVDADIVVAATDNERAQLRLAERVLAHDMPALFPALYETGGGEVFVSLGPAYPCLSCWLAGFRTGAAPLRAVSALRVETTTVVGLTVQLALGVLDPSSVFARLFGRRREVATSPTLFSISRPHAALEFARVQRVANCPVCQVGPAASQLSVNRATANPPALSEVRGAQLVASGILVALLIIAPATRNVVAILLMAISAFVCPYVVLGRDHGAAISRIIEDDFRSAVIGLLILALLVFSLAWRNAALIFVLGVTLAASSTALFWNRSGAG